MVSINSTSGIGRYVGIREHLGHHLVAVQYGEELSVAIECKTCHVVLLDQNRPDPDEAFIEEHDLSMDWIKKLREFCSW
jgi:hypothetical protein